MQSPNAWFAKISAPSAILLVLFLALASVSGTASAQDDFVAPISPIAIQDDPAGLNLATGKTTPEFPIVSVPAAPRLQFDRIQNAAPFIKGEEKENYLDGQELTGDWTVHTASGNSESFKCAWTVEGWQCSNNHGSGSGLKKSGRYYTQSGSGARYHFGNTHLHTVPAQSDPYPKWLRVYYASTITFPDGEVLTYQYDTASLPAGTDPYGRVFYRPNRIETNAGYFLTITYKGSVLGEPGWGSPAQVTIYAVAAPTTPLARMTYNSNGSATDLLGRTYLGVSGGDLGTTTELAEHSMTLPGEAAPSVQIVKSTAVSQSGGGLVGSITRDGVTYNYSYTNPQWSSALNDYRYDAVSVTGPAGYSAQYQIKLDGNRNGIGMANRVISATDPLGRTSSYQYDIYGRVVGMTAPEGNSQTVEYDAAGNLFRQTLVAKAGSGQTNLVQQLYVNLSGVPAVEGVPQCENIVMCWRPAWQRDARGNQTDLVYNSRGQPTEVLQPADASGMRTKTVIEYTSTGISRKAAQTICAAGTSCTGSGTFRTEYTYWGNTNLPLTVRQIDPATGQFIETSYTYDLAGRVLMVDGPLPGTDDATYTRYDVAGRKVWEIGPRDSNGLRAAVRTSYRAADDQILKVESGTVPGSTTATSPAVPVFSLLSEADTTYNARRLAVVSAVKASGVTYSVAQTSYDARNRPECTATRMNSAVYGSLPTSACTLGTTGANGPDRITKTIYDAAGQVLQVRMAVGTTLEMADVTYEYTLNGKIKQVIDANGNRAELRYDGLDRQTRWVFPSKTRPASFNPASPATAVATAGALNEADYEAYGYDANGNRTSLRKRDGWTITYLYDALNRMTQKTLPARTDLLSTHRRNVLYSYDLRGLQTSARFTSATGVGVTYGYDAYGRMLSETQSTDGVTRTVGSLYDAAGNRTRLTHSDGAYFSYEYDAANRFTKALWWNPANGTTTQFAAATYNSQGLPGTLNLASAWTNFAYDPVGRLNSLGHDFAGSAADVSWSFTRNPASQILTETQTNDTYSWDGHVNLTRSYATNGLNQHETAGSAAFCYDANGNLTADGASVYKYDIENRLVERRAQGTSNTNCAALSYAGTFQAELRYDPLGRLYYLRDYIGGNGITRFVYDGNAIIAEYNGSGIMLRRYVHGINAEADDPLVQFSGSAIDCPGTRFLQTDPRGSVIALADCWGNHQAINTYDEYGIPDSASGNDIATKGRFRYTGQAWIPELGMYYYKARVYSPTLGRFLQTDPIGYKDQFNLYAYVANDPVNKIDPTGTSCTTTGKEGSVTVDCKFDDRASFKKAGFSSSQIRAAERQYTRAVQKLLSNPDASHKIKVGDSTFKVTAGEIGRGLAKSYVTFDKGTGRASMAGGLSPLKPSDGPNGGLPFKLRIGGDFFKEHSNRYGDLNTEQRRTFIHEGIHTVPGESVMADQIKSGTFNGDHQSPYRDAATIFDNM